MSEKVTIEVESPVAGVLKENLAKEDCTAAVGQSIARVATSEQ
jgi:pyruvate/2-oxoglutarate dehydrogenase complex dihydrolipoamide acyltransferase (E2) component